MSVHCKRNVVLFLAVFAALYLTQISNFDADAQTVIFRESFSTDGDGTRYTMTGRGADDSPDAWEHTFALLQTETFQIGPGGDITLAAPRVAIPWHSSINNATAGAFPFFDSAVGWATGNASNLNVSFLVKDGATTSNLDAGDAALLDRLTNTLGHTVNLFDTTTASPAAIAASDLLLISDSLNIGNIYKSINPRDVAVPVVNYNAALTDDLLLTVSDGSVQQMQSMNVRAPSSPVLPSGLTQDQLVQLTDAKTSMSEYGQPRPGVSVLATYQGPFARSVSSLAVLDAMVAGTAGSNTFTGTIDIADLEDVDDGPAEDIWDDNLPVPGAVPNVGDNNFGFVATGKITVTEAGPYVFGVAGEDGGRLRINGQDVVTVDTGGFAYRSATVDLPTGEHDIEWSGRGAGGDAGYEISFTPAANFQGSVNVDDFDVLSTSPFFGGLKIKEPGLDITAYYLDVDSSPDVETDRPAILAAPAGTQYSLASAPFQRAVGDYILGIDMDSIPGSDAPPGTIEFAPIDLSGVANPKLTMNIAATLGLEAEGGFTEGVVIFVNDEQIASVLPNQFQILEDSASGTLLSSSDFRSLTWDLPAGLSQATILIEVGNDSSGEAIGIDEILITDGNPSPDDILGPVEIPENRIQQGVNGYLGVRDTEIRFSNPDADLSANVTLNPDGADGGGEVHTLTRFEDLFGDGENQIPLDKEIENATFNVNIVGIGSPLSLHRMLQDWQDNTATWNSLVEGIQADNVEALAEADDTQTAMGVVTWDVTESIRAWQADPDSNFGWAMLPTGTNGADYLSAEFADQDTGGVAVTPFLDFFLALAVLGDCNGDGVVDAADLQCVGDIEDRDIVLSAVNALPGDLDGNGDVAFADFLVLSANFGQDVSSYTDGDVDLNGNVAFPDFLVLSANFGKSAAAVAAAVPEPSALALVVLGLGGLMLRRRRR